MSFWDTVLSPYRGVFCHLFLIGIPYFRYWQDIVVLSTHALLLRVSSIPILWEWWNSTLKTTNPEETIIVPQQFCTIMFAIVPSSSSTPIPSLEDNNTTSTTILDSLSSYSLSCTHVEEFWVRDYVTRLLLPYTLAWMVWLTMRNTNTNAVAFHNILVLTTFSSFLTHVWLQQNYFYFFPEDEEDTRPYPFFETEFVVKVVLSNLLALILSIWTLSNYHQFHVPATMKWSIPGNAVFCGGVVNIFVAVASFQVLYEKDGIQHFLPEGVSVTPIVRVCFALSAVYTLGHAVILFRIRTFLNMRQLRTICLFKFLINIAMPIVWLPDTNPLLKVDQRLTFAIRAFVTSTYFFGFLWAGKAEGVSRILSGEKED